MILQKKITKNDGIDKHDCTKIPMQHTFYSKLKLISVAGNATVPRTILFSNRCWWKRLPGEFFEEGVQEFQKFFLQAKSTSQFQQNLSGFLSSSRKFLLLLALNPSR